MRAESDVEEIAEDRNSADKAVDRKVRTHARQQKFGRAQLVGADDDEGSKRSRHEIANARDEANQGIETKSDIGPRNDEMRVEPVGELFEIGDVAWITANGQRLDVQQW